MSGAPVVLAHLAFLLLVAATLGAGLRLLAWARLRDLGFGERTVLALGLGLGLVAVSVMWLGLAGLFRSLWFALLLAALLLLGARDLLGWLREAGARCRPGPGAARHAVYAALGLATLALGWLFCHVPPVFFDALVYHLGLPQQYLLRGGIAYLPHSHYSALPANAEMLYTLGLALGGELLAQLLSWWIGVLLALSVAVECARLRPGSGSIGFVAQLSMPVALFMAAHTGSDQAVALWVFQALMAARRWREGGDLRWFALLAACAGLAAGTKYTALYHLLPLALLFLVRPGERPAAAAGAARWAGRMAARALLGLGIALLIAGPWYARNLVNTGNPVYPAFYSVLGGSDWSRESAERVARDVRHGAGSELTLPGLLSIPWDLVMEPVRFGALGEAGRGLWLFALAALYAVARMPRARLPALYAALVVPFWLATSLNLRYILPLLAVLNCLAAAGLGELARRSRPAAWGVAAAVGAAVLSSFWVFLVTERQVFKPDELLFGRTGREAYLADTISYYPAARLVNDKLPPEARLLLVGETRLFYLRRRAEASSAYDRTLIVDMVRRAGSVDGVLCEMARQGFTHVLYNQPEAERLESGFDYFSWGSEHERQIFYALPGRLRPWVAQRWVFIFEVPPPSAACPPASGG